MLHRVLLGGRPLLTSLGQESLHFLRCPLLHGLREGRGPLTLRRGTGRVLNRSWGRRLSRWLPVRSGVAAPVAADEQKCHPAASGHALHSRHQSPPPAPNVKESILSAPPRGTGVFCNRFLAEHSG